MPGRMVANRFLLCQPARLAADLGYDGLPNLAKLVADGSAKRLQR
jgi:hypothetical protein